MSANPRNTDRLRRDQELRDIDDGLRRAQRRDQFRLEQRSAVRPRDIQRAMLDLQPQIVHFLGHGEGQAGLVFEDDAGQAKLVDGAALAALFELFADQLACVVLNGCYSEMQAQAIAQHIPYVIGMKDAISDRGAIAFSVGFYDALGAGRDVDFAHRFGCNAMQLEGAAGHLTPVLLKSERSPQTNPSDKMLRDAVSWDNPFDSPGRISPSRFFGRQEQLRRIFEELRKGSSLSLVGESQVGKSSLLAMVCHQAQVELGPLFAKIVHVDMQLIGDEADFFEVLCEELGLPSLLRGYKLKRALGERRYVVCLDEIEKMANRQNFTGDEREELRGLADGADAPLTLVIASRSPLDVLFGDDPMRCSPLAGICVTLRILPFSWAETQDFLRYRLQGNGIQFSLEQMEMLYTQTQGHPARLQSAAAELYRRLTQE